MKIVSLLRISLVLFLLFPFLFLFFQFRPSEVPDWTELWWAFQNSFYQALISASFSLLLGIWAALGIISVGQRRRKLRPILEILCLTPNFLPPLFVLLAALNILDPFPMGIFGIAIIHTLINFGLVAVIVVGIIENKIGSFAELAYVEGASKFFFLRKVFFPVLKKDLFLVSLFVFMVCFGSFAVPLIVGGGRGTTIEVLIYEKIRLSSHWGQAVVLATVQSIFIFSLSLLVAKTRAASSSQKINFKILNTPTGILLILISSLFFVVGYIQGLLEGLPLVSNFYEIQAAIAWGFVGSIVIGLLTGVLTFVLLMWIAYILPDVKVEKFLTGYMAPSTSLACFSFLIIGPNEGAWPFFKIPVALVLLGLGSLYKMGWEGKVLSLSSQVAVAQTMGASRPLIFKQIILPQVVGSAGILSGLAAVWAVGDFAVSRILAHRDISLGMMVETLMSSYRLNLATVLSLVILGAGLLCFIFFYWGARVLSRKPST